MSTATISPCGLYRYHLGREWSRGTRTALWIMLNPSTADATENDPTIRRCIAFSKAWGFDRLEVGNLYAYRSFTPNVLWSVADPVGPGNDDHLLAMARRADRIVCAWGQSGPMSRPEAVRSLLLRNGFQPYYLRLNKDGNPGHPLYLPGSLQPKEWSVAA